MVFYCVPQPLLRWLEIECLLLKRSWQWEHHQPLSKYLVYLYPTVVAGGDTVFVLKLSILILSN